MLKFFILHTLIGSLLYGGLMQIMYGWPIKISQLIGYICFGLAMAGFEYYRTRKALKNLGIKSLDIGTLNASINRKIELKNDVDLELENILNLLKSFSKFMTKKVQLDGDTIHISTTNLLGKSKSLVQVKVIDDGILHIIASDYREGKMLWFPEYAGISQLINSVELALSSTQSTLQSSV